MYSNKIYKIHHQDDSISESCFERNTIENSSDAITTCWYEIVKNHEKEYSSRKNTKYSFPWPYKKKECWYECKEDIGNFCEFSTLICLECYICRQLEIIIDSFIISEISPEIFILCLSTGCHTTLHTLIYFLELFLCMKLSIVIWSSSSWSYQNKIYTQAFCFTEILYKPWW